MTLARPEAIQGISDVAPPGNAGPIERLPFAERTPVRRLSAEGTPSADLIEARHDLEVTMTARWYITDNAVSCYVFCRRWPDSDVSWNRAEEDLLEMCEHATFRARDSEGREHWKSPRRTGSNLRWIVDTRPLPGRPGGGLPRVIWVGFSGLPERFWTP